MLQQLTIKNLILIESAQIPFAPGFNVITGETGAGKTAMTQSLRLLKGEKADASCIRHGEEKCLIEALFEITPLDHLVAFLDEIGIEHEPGEPLILRREITRNGRNRAFVNQQPVQTSLLKQISEFLFEIVGQHASFKLFSSDQQREILDQFADLSPIVKAFGKEWRQEQTLRRQLTEEKASIQERERLRQHDASALQEIEEASLQEGEEEELFQEYTRLNNAEELRETTETLVDALWDEGGIIPRLTQLKHPFQKLAHTDKEIAPTAELYRTSLAELQEVGHHLQRYADKICLNPYRLQEVQDRLTLFDQLKKKYKPSIEEILSYAQELKQRLLDFQQSDDRIDTLESEITTLSKKNDDSCTQIHDLRQKAAQGLESILEQELAELNMPHAKCEIRVVPTQRTAHGDDQIQFFFQPNKGERLLPLKECASGGELSRFLLALETILASKTRRPLLIFDEIDANIGGRTASLIGEKLQVLGKQHQLLAISHFPQVAQHATHHILIQKVESGDRTLTRIRSLEKEERSLELQRMAGLPTETKKELVSVES